MEKAKEITARFQSTAFAPPPRSVNDILHVIESHELADNPCEARVEFTDNDIREMMDRSPPFAPFVWPNKVGVAQNQAQREFLRGNYRRGVKYLQWAVDAIPESHKGALAARYAILASYLAFADQPKAARRAISKAEYFAASSNQQGVGSWIAYVGNNVNLGRGAIADAMGELTQAEAHYRRGIQLGESHIMGISGIEGLQITKITLAGNLTRQGRLVEAENVVREVLEYRLEHAIYSPIVSAALARLTEILFEQGRYGDALALAKANVTVFRGMCARPESLYFIITQNVIARSLVAQDRWQEALAQYKQIRSDMSEDVESFERLFENQLGWALALLNTERFGEANRKLEAALERAERNFGSGHYETAEIRGFRGIVRNATGDHQGALRDFESAVRVLLKQSGEASTDGTGLTARDKRLMLILEGYIRLLENIRGTELEQKAGFDAVSLAFQMAEVARSPSVQRALAASGARAALGDPNLADLARREQDAKKQIAALHGRLAELSSKPFSQKKPGLIKATRERVKELTGARAALKAQIEAQFPTYAALINPRPATINDARGSLHSDEALLSIYVGRERVYVWAVPKAGPVEFEAIDLDADALEESVAFVRTALDPKATTLGDIPKYEISEAYKLYAALLKPVEAGWKNAKSLLITANGALGFLPFSVLPTQEAPLEKNTGALFAEYRTVPWLARTHAVTVVPSVASIKSLRTFSASTSNRRPFIGFGDPVFGETPVERKPEGVEIALRVRAAPKTTAMESARLDALPALPDTADELRSIAKVLKADPKRDIFLGKAASETNVKSTDLSAARVIAFATHGLVPGDLDGLTQPALALSSPAATQEDEDGLLTMGEVLGLKLDADWVVLSACNTAAGEGAGAEAVSGLGRAFFYAGARALLVTNWPVETTSARVLTTELFRQQESDSSLTRAEALRLAMLAMIDGPGYVNQDGRVVFSYAHPIFWAPFSLVGDGGGSVSRN